MSMANRHVDPDQMHRIVSGSVTKFAGILADDEAELLASTANIDRMNDIVSQKGIDDRAWLAGGAVILRDHNSGWPVANGIRAGVEAAGYTVRIRFAPWGASEVADETRRLVKAGVLRGVSIGFMPIEFELIDQNDYYSGYLFKEIELMEISICSVPANRESLVIGKSWRGAALAERPTPAPSVMSYAGDARTRRWYLADFLKRGI
jgi:HK97 family phage prohead protease